jgi:hypothetical protein
VRIAVIALSVLLAAPASAFLCTRAGTDGPSLAWQVREFEMRPHDAGGAEISPAELADALDLAVAEWTSAACSDLVVTTGPATSTDRVGFDWAAGRGSPPNENIVVFRDDASDVGQWLHSGTAVAITTVSFELATGEIMDADIELNDGAFVFTACDLACQPIHDLQNTLTHEVGHALGLDHPPSNQTGAAEATMFASTNPGDLQKRDLADNDLEGLCTIYPAGEPDGECFGVPRLEPGAVTVAPGCRGASAASPRIAPVLLLIGLGLYSRRRR